MNQVESIKAKLKNLSVKEGKPYDYILMLYFIERLLYRLSISKYANNFVLKGGLLLFTIFENDARATRDVDFLARRISCVPEELAAVFSEISKISGDDSVRFESDNIYVEPIKEDGDYQGFRIKFSAYLDKSRHVLQFDIGFGDVIYPDAVEMEYPSLLDMERPRLKAYSMESVIAEKFHAMIHLAEANSRMKDFYDIYKLCYAFDFDGNCLFEAISRTIKRRKTPLTQIPTVFSDTFTLLSDKETQWRSFQKRIGVASGLEYQEVIAGIKAFLAPIYQCIYTDQDFFGRWDHIVARWVTDVEQRFTHDYQ